MDACNLMYFACLNLQGHACAGLEGAAALQISGIVCMSSFIFSAFFQSVHPCRVVPGAADGRRGPEGGKAHCQGDASGRVQGTYAHRRTSLPLLHHGCGSGLPRPHDCVLQGRPARLACRLIHRAHSRQGIPHTGCNAVQSNAAAPASALGLLHCSVQLIGGREAIVYGITALIELAS